MGGGGGVQVAVGGAGVSTTAAGSTVGGADVAVAAAATATTVAVGGGVAVKVATTFGVAGAAVGGGAVRRLPISAAPSVYPVTMTTTTPAAINPQRNQGLPPKPEPLLFIVYTLLLPYLLPFAAAMRGKSLVDNTITL